MTSIYQEAKYQFAANLRKFRTEKNITQEELAERINKSIEHVSFLERGERAPSFEVIIELASALEVSVSELMNINHGSESLNLINNLVVNPVVGDVDTVAQAIVSRDKRASDLERLESAIMGIREMQNLADEYGIHDILQDNGGKVLQVLILLGLRNAPSREGNDAIDADENEYELKTINRSLNKNAGVTTHHHLNKDIINKYRKVKAWYIAIYEGIELKEIYRVNPTILEPLFQKWEQRVELEGPLNNPKISITKYVKKGELVYPPPLDE